jgi:hypothetical protein
MATWFRSGRRTAICPLIVTVLYDEPTGRLVALIEMTEQGQGRLCLES